MGKITNQIQYDFIHICFFFTEGLTLKIYFVAKCQNVKTQHHVTDIINPLLYTDILCYYYAVQCQTIILTCRLCVTTNCFPGTSVCFKSTPTSGLCNFTILYLLLVLLSELSDQGQDNLSDFISSTFVLVFIFLTKIFTNVQCQSNNLFLFISTVKKKKTIIF